MVFGRKDRRGEPPVEPIEWRGVREFGVGKVERPATPRRNRIGWGPNAVRVPRGDLLVPCAFIGPSSGASVALFEDALFTRAVCVVSEPREVDGARCYDVLDAAGSLVGTLWRVPPARRLRRHTWRIDQPDRPEITGRGEWSGIGAKGIAGRLAGKAFEGVVQSVLDLGAEGGDQPTKPRTLEWLAADELVMVSRGTDVRIHADWLDRRLAFAFAVVADN
ncbi:hypothetical protein [Actinomadura atramentaria]|uniref:hypothetical protein n=1 Tax=Actinomadura atramentaria TaxID=1990 RepID=UPI0003628C75|nr:hypothetical protein [Actinomadura atramentaria]